jgi:hypothetical protein
VKSTASSSPKSWHRERRHGAIAAVTAAFLFGGLLSGYGVHAQMLRAAKRVEAHNMQLARATAAALDQGAVLFVPQFAGTCRRRWIDNATWMLRDGGEVDCELAANWHATGQDRQQKVEQRLDAISKTFQSRASGKPD